MLYDLTDTNNPHKVTEFLPDARPNFELVGATPVISADGTKVSVQQVNPSTNQIDKVVTYSLATVENTMTVTDIGHVNTPDSTSRIAMSDDGDWLVVPQYVQDNPIKLYSWDAHSNVWHLEYSDASTQIKLAGPASPVSPALSNFEHGRVAVSVPPSTGPGGGELLLVDADGTRIEIESKIVKNSIGSVALSQDGQFLVGWDTLGGLYDLTSQRVCHTFQTADYSDARTPFALSRTGGWFAEASTSGVTLFKIHATHQSCTLSEEAHVNLGNTSSVAFGGDSWLVVTGRETILPSGDPCTGGCEVLRLFSITELISESPPPQPEQVLPERALIDMSGDVRSISMSADGAFVATGGDYVALYDLTDLNNAHLVVPFIEEAGGHCQNTAAVGVTPILSADATRIAVPICADYGPITQVNTYTLDSAGTPTLDGSVNTPDGTTHIAMSDAGDWLVIPQSTTDNPVNLYSRDLKANSWVKEFSSASQQISLAGPAGDVSVSLSNYDNGRLAVAVGPPDGPQNLGEVLLADVDGSRVEIQDLLVRGSIGSLALSQDGQFLATWNTHAGVYDLQGLFVCHTFQTADYADAHTPFALSRTGGWFAEASPTGVTLYKIHSSVNSCTLSQEAHMPLELVSAVAFGGEEWLAVTAKKSESCVGGCKALRVYNVNDLVSGEPALEVHELAV